MREREVFDLLIGDTQHNTIHRETTESEKEKERTRGGNTPLGHSLTSRFTGGRKNGFFECCVCQ